MKKHLVILLTATAMLTVGCYDHNKLEDRLDAVEQTVGGLEGEVESLKGLIDQCNSNVSGLRSIVEEMQKGSTIKSVVDVKDEAGKVIGYTITFSDNKVITIYNGKDGEPGTPGAPGSTPAISVILVDGVYYWTVDGKILEVDGQPVPVTGEKGEPGEPGKDGLTPQFRINNGNWEVSFDGKTWTVVGSASGSGSGGAASSPLSRRPRAMSSSPSPTEPRYISPWRLTSQSRSTTARPTRS